MKEVHGVSLNICIYIYLHILQSGSENYHKSLYTVENKFSHYLKLATKSNTLKRCFQLLSAWVSVGFVFLFSLIIIFGNVTSSPPNCFSPKKKKKKKKGFRDSLPP